MRTASDMTSRSQNSIAPAYLISEAMVSHGLSLLSGSYAYSYRSYYYFYNYATPTE